MSGFRTAEELGPFLEFITGTQPGRRNSARSQAPLGVDQSATFVVTYFLCYFFY